MAKVKGVKGVRVPMLDHSGGNVRIFPHMLIFEFDYSDVSHRSVELNELKAVLTEVRGRQELPDWNRKMESCFALHELLWHNMSTRKYRDRGIRLITFQLEDPGLCHCPRATVSLERLFKAVNEVLALGL